MLDGVFVTPLNRFKLDDGDVLHALKSSEESYAGFGEVYFSMINEGKIKGWKKHLVMTMNLVVPIGHIKFVLFDCRDTSSTKGQFASVSISKENYCRLTIPPGIWVAFKGLDTENVLANISNVEHDPDESITLPIESLLYEWW